MTIPPLSRSALDRDHAGRMRQDSLETALRDPHTRIVLIDGDRTMVDGGTVVRIPPSAVPEGARLTWLGRTRSDGATPAGSIVLAAYVDADAANDAAAAVGTWQSLREIGADLDDEDAGALTQAVALGRWHASHGFSAGDGSALQLAASGWSARDDAGTEHFPRIDPAVIALVTDPDDERILLGRNVAWPDRFSLFAGFVDPGESLEAAVIREVHEEAGVTVADPRYVASQPWPFPRSLMLGFQCIATDPEAAEPDREEIAEVRWLTRQQVRDGAVTLPSGASIASFLIRRWLG